MNALLIALRGKGIKNAVRRAAALIRCYGWTAKQMNQTLDRLTHLLSRYGCQATWPITAVALARNDAGIRQLAQQGVEFAIHGHTHIDHSTLSAEEQIERIGKALSIFARSQIQPRGFRCPYLRWNQGTLDALRHHHLLYDSSQALTWNVSLEGKNEAYLRALEFYGAQPAANYLSLPYLDQGLIRIPYSLPDDEALVDRLRLPPGPAMAELWVDILEQTWQSGEVFVLGLHPERFRSCAYALEATLAQAQTLTPHVWIARLDEIATWWQERFQTQVQMDDLDDGFHITVKGDDRVALMAHGVAVSAATKPWFGPYQRIEENDFVVHTPVRPWIGLSMTSPAALADFLKQQGYIVEISDEPQRYSIYLDEPGFAPKDQRLVFSRLQNDAAPLIKLATWPNGARSALSITGDIDALTLWDYGKRLSKQ